MRDNAQMAAEDAGGGRGGEPGMEERSREEPTTWSNEDPHKIHLCMRAEANVSGIRMDTAGNGGGAERGGGAGRHAEMLDSDACGDRQSEVAGGAAVGVETAAERAACHVAWHTSSRASGASE